MAQAAYSPSFFAGIKQTSEPSADVIVPLVCDLLHPQSVIDVGCGDGTWLAAFREAGVPDLLGVDGPWVNPETFAIGADYFRPVNLAHPYQAPRTFDLVVSLEVAEHLPALSAATFVRTLIGCGRTILFSAAIPGQGGTGHVNEQWPNYWVRLFAHEGYVPIDVIRPRFWNHPAVAWWYAQNALLFVPEGSVWAQKLRTDPPLPLVHPRHYEAIRRELIASDLRQQPIRRLLRAALSKIAHRLLGRHGV